MNQRSDKISNAKDALSPEKQALFELLLNKRKRAESQSSSAATPSISRRPQGMEDVPLSFAQEQFWLLDQIAPDSPVYNIPMAFRIVGALNVAALEQSLNEIIRRHEVLRSTCTAIDGKPTQRIIPELVLSLPVIDLSHLPHGERHQAVAKYKDDTAHQPFDLAAGPLIRATLLLIENDSEHQEHIFLLNLHHFVADGWSMGLFYEELTSLYTCLISDHPNSNLAPLPQLPIQYGDFAHWQRQRIRSATLTEQLQFWKEQLADVESLTLPTDRPRPAIQSHRGASYRFTLSPTLSDALRGLSQREGVTLFMTLMAAFQALLYRYTQQEDILVATAVSNRLQSETERLLGSFANNLLLRGKVDGAATFRDLLTQVREVAVKAYAHQEFPFAQLIKELLPEQERQDLSRNPLFQVMFTLHERPEERTLQLANLTVESQPIPMRTSKIDLDLTIINRANAQANSDNRALIASFEYNSDLFDESTVQRMANHYRVLLEAIVTHMDQALNEIPLLTASERHQLLVDWNNTQTDYPRNTCIHQLIETQAAQTPKAIALVFENQKLTYGDLNRRSNQVAHYLQHMGVGPDVLVGICVERSLDMVVGLLGILKAGGCYVPLDPAYPDDRLGYMVEASKLSILLTQQQFQEKFVTPAVQIVNIDADWQRIANENIDNPHSNVSSDNLAYIIYTSGSTGKPKGVQLCHRSVVNFLASMKERPGLNQQDTLLAVTTISFDIAVLELYLPLMVGARVILASRQAATSAERLSTLLADNQITLMQATPATWQMLLIGGWQGQKQLKLLCGGEAMPRDLAAQLIAKSGELWNMYGPTETTVWSAACQIQTSDTSIPVAGPIANTQLYILPVGTFIQGTNTQEHTTVHPLPIGIPGEVYIGGEGLARGYLNRPDLTSERFIPDPFSNKPEARLYKTGDLARYRPDGTLEFLGRIDHQVKIRGFRIELGEIETALEHLPQIQKGLALVREDNPGDKRLVAYVIPSDNAHLNSSELRQSLRQTLPDYMVPSAFVQLETFPLTPNGKIDRRALPQPDLSQTELKNEFVAPRTLVEQTVAQIWCDLLKLERVGIYDNFFELGGHSLLATQMLTRIYNEYQVEMALAALFESPTIDQFTVKLTLAIGGNEHSEIDNSDIACITDLLDELDELSDDMVDQYMTHETYSQLT